MGVTTRDALLECLEMMRMLTKLASVGMHGRIPLAGQEDLFYERQAKCRLIQELIQANESEPVRHAIANWQKMLMDGEKPNTKDLEAPK